MGTVRALLNRKGHTVIAVPPHATALEAARIMGDNGFGAVLVIDDNALVGIFTERDVLRRIVVAGCDAATTPVNAVMTSALISCVPETTLDECGAIMTTRRIRHLPVVDADGLHGVISSGDLLAYRVSEQEDTIKYLNDYMFNTR